MKLDTVALIVVAIAAGGYFIALLTGAIITSAFGIGIPFLVLLLIGAWLLWRVIADRRANAEDDYYEKNVER